MALLKRLVRQGFIASNILMVAAAYGHSGTVAFLVKKLGADANKADTEGDFPLLVAAKEGRVEVVRCLGTELGADVNKAGVATPLLMAAKNSHIDVVRYLGKELGADVNKAKDSGVTPL